MLLSGRHLDARFAPRMAMRREAGGGVSSVLGDVIQLRSISTASVVLPPKNGPLRATSAIPFTATIGYSHSCQAILPALLRQPTLLTGYRETTTVR